MISKKVWTTCILAGALGAMAAAYFLLPLLHRAKQPGLELLELLPPDMDLYAVADVQSLGRNLFVQKLLSNPAGFPRDAEYEQFIQATGFHYESDLNRLALAKAGPDWVGAARISADRARMVHYLESQGAEEKNESGKTIVTVGHFRFFRLVFLNDNAKDTVVAFSVGGDATQIRQAIERHAGRLRGSAASEIEQKRYLNHIAAGSQFWLMARPDRLLEIAQRGEAGASRPVAGREEALAGEQAVHSPRKGGATDQQLGGEIQIGPYALNSNFFRGSKMLYVSLESGAEGLSFRVEDYCDNPSTAQRIASSIQGMLALVQMAPSDKSKLSNKSKAAGINVKSLLAGMAVEQVKESVFLRWQWDEGTLGFLEGKNNDQ